MLSSLCMCQDSSRHLGRQLGLVLEHGCAHGRDQQRMMSLDWLVVNLSSKSLSDTQKRVLAKGLKFAPVPKSIPVKEIVMNVESGLRGVPQ